MGCGSCSRVTVITVNSSSVTIDDLPVEILYKIFDQLEASTIFQSLFYASKYFNQIVSNYNRFHFNFKSMSLRTCRTICSHIDPEQIIQLTLTNDENSSGLLEYFLQKFSLDKFVRLRTLNLLNVEDEELITRILIPIAERESNVKLFSIKIIDPNESYDEIFSELLTSILSQRSLSHFHSILSYNRLSSNPISCPENCAIRNFTFGGSCSIEFLRNLFSHTLDLQTLEVNEIDFDDETDLNEQPTIDNETTSEDEVESEDEHENDQEENPLPPPPPPIQQQNQIPKQEKFQSIGPTENLQSLIINSCSISMLKIEWLLREMINLKHLRLFTTTGYEDLAILDGNRWKNLLTHINKFQCIFSMNIDEDLSWNAEECLRLFQTSFWTEEKCWFMALENYKEDVLLYTLPYLNDSHVMKIRSDPYEYRTTTTTPSNSSLIGQSMNNVSNLYINVLEFSETSIEDSTGPHFSCVSHLCLYDKWPRSRGILNTITKFVNLTPVEEFSRDDSLPTDELIKLVGQMPNLRSIKTTTHFLDSLNAAKFSFPTCLRSLIIEPLNYERQKRVNIEPFCAMFPRIQYLTMPVENVDSCEYVVEQLKNDLIKVIFRISSNDDDDDDDDPYQGREATVDDSFTPWLEQLPKSCLLHRKYRQIHIWFQ